jgi:hypothetical protein
VAALDIGESPSRLREEFARRRQRHFAMDQTCADLPQLDLDQTARLAIARRTSPMEFEEQAMSGETIYLGLIFGAFLIFAATIAYVSVLERRR